MTPYRFEAGKTYRTRDGREAYIYAVDGSDPYPIHGKVDGYMNAWTLSGRADAYSEEQFDLLSPEPVKHKRKVWINCYKYEVGGAFTSRGEADVSANAHRIACIEREIEYFEGEGL